MTYESLFIEAETKGITVYENDCIGKLQGLYVDNTITINSSLETSAEKLCVLAEELAHHHTSHGDILDQNKTENRKQEYIARAHAYNRLVSLERLIKASDQGVRNRHELAEYLGVSEAFIEDAIKYYRGKYGVYCSKGIYIICFDPLGVLKQIK